MPLASGQHDTPGVLRRSHAPRDPSRCRGYARDVPDDPLLEIADELYGLAPSEFTAARDAAAKEHKADKPFAARIKKLKKPSVAAWAVNLLVRRESEQVDQMLGVGTALRQAQEGMDAALLRELTQQRRTLTHAIAGRARFLAADDGHRLTQTALDQVEATLTAAMIDEGAARAVRSGLLIQTLAATGVEAVDAGAAVAIPEALGFTASPRAEPHAKAPRLHVVPDPDRDEKARAAAQQDLNDAEETLAARRRDLDEAEAEVEEREAESLRLQAEIEEVRRRLADLEAVLESAEDDLALAEEVRDTAEAEHEQATRARDAAARAFAALAPPQG